MPFVPASELNRGRPYLLVNRARRYSIGWQDAERDGPSFVVAETTAIMGTTKVHDRFPLTEDGWADAWRALVRLDRAAAQDTLAMLDARAQIADQVRASEEATQQLRERERERRQAFRRERAARLAGTTALQWLGVAVRDGQVYKYALAVAWGGDAGRYLGKLAGARAEVTGGRAGHRRSGAARTADVALLSTALGPAALLAGASRTGTQGSAFVVFADGTVHEKRITDAASFVRAQSDAVRFNALAAAAGQAAVPAANEGNEPEIPVRLACGHVTFVTDPRTVSWLRIEGGKSYYCRKCDADRPVTAIGEAALHAEATQTEPPVLETTHELTERLVAEDSESMGSGQSADPGQSSGQTRSNQQPTARQLTDELERLANLHASGALTDAEFQAAKDRLLGT